MKPDDGDMFLWIDLHEEVAISYTKPMEQDYEKIGSGGMRCLAIKSCEKTGTAEIGEVIKRNRACRMLNHAKFESLDGKLSHRCT